MAYNIYFLNHDAPEFAAGVEWYRCDGATGEPATIVRITPYAVVSTPTDYTITYRTIRGREFDKNIWDFQVRYTPHKPK